MFRLSPQDPAHACTVRQYTGPALKQGCQIRRDLMDWTPDSPSLQDIDTSTVQVL